MANPMMNTESSMPGAKRAAILLISLGSQLAAEVLKYVPERAVERLSLEMFNTRTVTPDEQEQVLQSAQQLVGRCDAEREGGMQYVRDMLSQTMGKDRAEQFLTGLLDRRKGQSFSFLNEADPESTAGLLRNEHPQAVALVLSHLRPTQAARILNKLEPELQAEVAARIAMIDRFAPEVVKEVEANLQKKLSSALMRDETGRQWGGVSFLVQILNQERSMEKTVLDSLTERDPELADAIRNQLFVFEDILKLDDRTVQRILRDVDQKDLILAIRGAKPEVRDHIMKNMSKRAAQMLEEELGIMRPVRLSSIETAQQRVVGVIRHLEESEEIMISRGGQSDVLI
jgi:flagellar motor switch protein FliG